MRMTNRQEKEEAACELYELLNNNFLAEGFMFNEVYEGLRQNAISCCEEMESCFISFLGTPGCAQLMDDLRREKPWTDNISVDEVDEADEAAPPIPITDVVRDGLLATLERLDLPQAVSAVDASVAGLPLVHVQRGILQADRL